MAGIEGKVVVITGASSGIGEATATLLAARGARLVLGARRPERLAEVAARLGGARFVETDVRRRADVQRLVDLATGHYGRLDVFVTNAGIGPISPLEELRVEDWDAMVDINIKGALYGIAAALPVFRAQRSGHFVTTLSTAGLKVVPGQAVYAGTKNAVRTICEGLRQEAGPDIRVTTVSPGFVFTDFAGQAPDPTTRAQMLERRGQIAIPPDAIARAMAYAIEQPADVDVNEIVVRPTAQA